MASLRLLARLALIALGLLVCLGPHYVALALRRRSPWPRRFLRWTGWVAGLRVTIAGEPLTARVLYAANHVSWLDILAVAGATGATFVSKAEVAGWPVVGWLARLNGSVFVARAERSAVRGQADALRSALRSGRPVALFPEGTVSDGPELLPFRSSLFAALLPPSPGVSVQPVAIDYGTAAAAISWTGDEPIGANARRVLGRAEPTPVTLRFLPPIDPAAAGDRKTLAARARASVAEALGLYAPR